MKESEKHERVVEITQELREKIDEIRKLSGWYENYLVMIETVLQMLRREAMENESMENYCE